VTTDLNTYRFLTTATITVSVGDVLTAGDYMSNGLSVMELAEHGAILPATVQALTLDNDFVSGNLVGALSFANATVSLNYIGADDDGRTIVEFDVQGFPGDPREFWDVVHTTGADSGKTLANYLDVRTAPVGEPTAASLPTTINPAQFLVDNILGNNLFLIFLRPNQFLGTVADFSYLNFLRTVIPPHTTYMIYVDFGEIAEYYGVGGGYYSGYEESGVVEETSLISCGTGDLDEDYQVTGGGYAVSQIIEDVNARIVEGVFV